MAHAGGRHELVLGLVAAEDLADLEQRDIGRAAIDVGLCGRDQSGQQARPHVGEIRRNRIGERELGLSAAEHLGRRLWR